MGSRARAIAAIAIAAGFGCQLDTSGAGGTSVGSLGSSSGLETQGEGPASTDGGSGVATGEGTTAASSPTTGGADSTAGTAGSGSETGPDPDTGSTSGDSTGLPVSCDRALWVLGNLDVGSTADAQFHQRLVDLGYDVTLALNSDAQASDVGDNCLVVLSAVGSSGDVGSEFRDVAVPVLTMEAFLYDDMQMVASDFDCGTVEPADVVDIVDAAHPMAGGASGNVSVYSVGSQMGWGVVEPTALVVGVDELEPWLAMIFGYEAGAMMAGLAAPARRVGFPASGANGRPTPEGLDLFEAAVSWAVQ